MTTKDWQSEVDAAAKECAIKHEAMLRAGNNGKGHYLTDGEYVANYFGRMGGFISAASWAREKLEEREAKLIWLVRHAIFTASISRAKGAELLGIPLIDLDEALKAWRGEG